MNNDILFDIQPEINSIHQANESIKEKMIRMMRTLIIGELYVISGGDISGVVPIDEDNDEHWGAVQEYNNGEHPLVNVVVKFLHFDDNMSLGNVTNAITNAPDPLDTDIYLVFTATLNEIPVSFLITIEKITRLNHYYTERQSSKRRTGSTFGGRTRRRYI